MELTFYTILVALLFGLGACCFFLWAIRDGQFKDVEGIKYRLLDVERGIEEDKEKE